MKAIKVIFGGRGKVSLDWNAKVDGLSAVAQRAGVAVTTHLGSDQFLPDRGTEVAKTLFTYGAFDLLGVQHVLNFGALKARDDMRKYEAPTRAASAKIATIRMRLLKINANSEAEVSVSVTNQEGRSTFEILQIP
jgi:hypothetical protein